MKIKTGKAMSVPEGLLLSLTVNVTITVLAAFILATLLTRNSITWNNIGYWIMLTILTAAFTGGKIAIVTIKTHPYLISFMSGLVYWMLLLCITALFFGGQYSSVFETGALIFSGSIVAALISCPQNRKISQKRRRSYR